MEQHEQVPEHTSVFVILPWEDDELPGGPFFLMVHNREDDKDGKPGGWGLPGGGQEQGEAVPDTAMRELYGEAGLAAGVPPTTEIFRQSSFRARDPRTNRVRYASSLAKLNPGDEEEVSRGTKVAVEIPMGSLVDSSQLTSFFRGAATSKQDEDGVFVRLDDELADHLGVRETDEIDGLGLIAASAVARLGDQQAALPPHARSFYLSHLGILRAYLRSQGAD